MTSDSGTLVVKAANGTSWTWQYESATAVRQGGRKVSRSDLPSGEHVLAAGPVTAGNREARVIIIARAKSTTPAIPRTVLISAILIGAIFIGPHQFQLTWDGTFPATDGAAGTLIKECEFANIFLTQGIVKFLPISLCLFSKSRERNVNSGTDCLQGLRAHADPAISVHADCHGYVRAVLRLSSKTPE